MSDRPGQLLIYDDVGNFIGGATILIAPSASVVNGRLSLPGLSEGIDGLPANPTAQVGLSTVNGAATTFMRSDAAPALSQAISPLWTGPHTFKGGFRVEDADGADRIWLDSNGVYLQTAPTTLYLGDFAVGLNVGGASWVVVDDATHSMDLGDVDGWGNLSHVAIEDDDQQVRLHATTVKVEKGLLALGVAGTNLGRLTLAGSTSGVVTVQPAAVAGTWTLTLPTNAGTNRYPLLTNGAGVTSWGQLAASDISGLGTAAVLNVGTSSGDIPVLGSGGKLASSVLPALAISDTFVVASQAAMLALTAETGDVAVRTDLNKSFILAGTNPATLAHWQELLTPTDAVLSVNGQTGAVVLTTSHIAEGSNLYYTQGRFDTAFAAKSTTNLAEGTNLYYTDERVDDRVAALIQGTTNQITPTYNDAAGTLTLSLPQNIHTGASPTFTGLTLSGNLSTAGVASSLIPSVTDTYDLGSSTKLWRKGWLSELDAVLFAQNTVSVIGGWLLVTKNEGAIPVGQDIGASDTSIDFGQAMTANDFVLFRAAGSVEYVQVGTLVSGTRYNVTRNLDGSGANAWPAGSVYAVLGNTTNGRIEINANSTPRISLIKQGATYNAQTELLRVGDLNGGWGYGAETYGFAAGEYAAGKAWVSVDPTNGFRVGSHTTIRAQIAADGSAFFGNNNLSISSAGVLTAGAWQINSSSITSGGITLAASATAANNKIYVGAGNYNNADTAIYLGGDGRVSFKDKLTWDGTTLNIVGGGTFSGALSAATGTFAGALSAATGTFAGSLSAATGTFAGSLTAASGNITGVLQISTAGGALAVGTTPPTSASAGTGIWFDRTGIYGLASDVVQAKFDAATGKITAGGGNVNLDANGLSIIAGVTTANAVGWTSSGTTIASHAPFYSIGSTNEAWMQSQALSKSGDGTGRAINAMYAFNASNFEAAIYAVRYGATHATQPGRGFIILAPEVLSPTGAGGVVIGAGLFSSTVANAMLDVRGAGIISGNLTVDTTTLVVDATNNRVGIGTASPGQLLDLRGNVSTTLFAYLKNSHASGTGGFQVENDNVKQCEFGVRGSARASYGALVANDAYFYGNGDLTLMVDAATGIIKFATGGNTERVRILANGTLRFSAYGAGTLTTDASGNVTATSDERLKDVKGMFGDGLDMLRRINPIVYRWKEKAGRDTKNDYIGFSAQNVQAALPLAVMAGLDGMLSLQDRPLIAATVNAVKELDWRIAELERELETLKRARLN